MIVTMLKNLLSDLRDFVQMFFDPEAVYARNIKPARGLDAPREDWSYPR